MALPSGAIRMRFPRLTPRSASAHPCQRTHGALDGPCSCAQGHTCLRLPPTSGAGHLSVASIQPLFARRLTPVSMLLQPHQTTRAVDEGQQWETSVLMPPAAVNTSDHTRDAHAECVSLVYVASSEVCQTCDSLPNFDAGCVSDSQRVSDRELGLFDAAAEHREKHCWQNSFWHAPNSANVAKSGVVF